MKSFFNFRRSRYTAVAMLIVWLMTLGIGVANACLLAQVQDQGQGRQGLSVPVSLQDHRNADVHPMSPDTPVCLSFCAAEQTTVAKVPHQLGDAAGFDFVPVLFLTGLRIPALTRMSQPQVLDSPTRSEPPLFIRFLRLTI